jgi:hypothetical protein
MSIKHILKGAIFLFEKTKSVWRIIKCIVHTLYMAISAGLLEDSISTRIDLQAMKFDDGMTTPKKE